MSISRHRPLLVLSIVLVLLGLLAAGPGAAKADDWAAPQTQTFKSKRGGYVLTVVPNQGGGWGRTSTATLRKGAKTIWSRKLPNCPMTARIFVHKGKAWVVTLDTWGHLGYRHTLVIFGPGGKMVRDLRLEDLLPANEIRKHVMHSISSRWWRRKATIAFVVARGRPALRISFKWGKRIALDLRTGRGQVP